MKYLMSDIHGEYDIFIKMLKKINFSDNDELIILGDVVDRGGKPIKLLQYIMSKPNMSMILGNHEFMMLSSFEVVEGEIIETIELKDWKRIGGMVTYYQFIELPKNKKLKILEYLNQLKLYQVIDNKILVHAGLPIYNQHICDINTYLSELDPDVLLWDRSMVANNLALEGYHIYCGHTPTKALTGMNKIEKRKGFTMIDCGCVFYGKLGCYCLDNDETFYIEKS